MINDLLGEAQDSYIDIYFIIKNRLMEGVEFKLKTKTTNFGGVQLIKGPKTLKTVSQDDAFIKLLPISFYDERLINQSRINLVNSKNSLLYNIFKDEKIRLTITTTNSCFELSDNSYKLLHSPTVKEKLSEVQFEPEDFISFHFKIEGLSPLREQFEKNFDTDKEIETEKKKVIYLWKEYLKNPAPKFYVGSYNNVISTLKNYELIPKDQADISIEELTKIYERYSKNHKSLKTFKTVVEQKKSGPSPAWESITNYDIILKKLLKEKKTK